MHGIGNLNEFCGFLGLVLGCLGCLAITAALAGVNGIVTVDDQEVAVPHFCSYISGLFFFWVAMLFGQGAYQVARGEGFHPYFPFIHFFVTSWIFWLALAIIFLAGAIVHKGIYPQTTPINGVIRVPLILTSMVITTILITFLASYFG